MAFIKNLIVTLVEGARKFGPPEWRNNITEYGEYNITSVMVGRHPIDSMVKKIANWITLGDLEKNQKKLNYDSIYHLYMLLKCVHPMTGEVVVLKMHKEEVVLLAPVKDFSLAHPEHQGFTLQPDKPIPLAVFIHRAEKRLGQQKFYEYDVIKLNCQHFVSNAILANSMRLNPEQRKFISQDAIELISRNSTVSGVMKAMTNMGSLWHRIRHGTGIGIPDVTAVAEKK